MNPNKVFRCREKGFLSLQKLDFALGRMEKVLKNSRKFPRRIDRHLNAFLKLSTHENTKLKQQTSHQQKPIKLIKKYLEKHHFL
jgi:hypothetical protein